MSLWTRFRDTVVGVAKVAVGTAIGGPLGGAIAGTIGGNGRTPPTLPTRAPGLPQGPVFPGVGATGFVGALPTVIRVGGAVLRSPAVRAGAAAAAGAILGDTLFDEQGRPVGTRRKRRRMNPCNPKALNRAVRRLSMYHKQNKKIEAQLRKLAPRPRARRAVPHHHHTVN